VHVHVRFANAPLIHPPRFLLSKWYASANLGAQAPRVYLKPQDFEAAYQIFSAKGFAHAQVTAVAQACHVSTATIYKLFPSKEVLFLAAYHYGLDLLEAHVLNSSACDDPREGL
jgi:hypothetical protein